MKAACTPVGVYEIEVATPTGRNVLQEVKASTNLSGSRSAQDFYTFTVDSASNVVVSISGGSGDADLYVKAGSKPTTSSYDCRPYRNGNSEQCSVSAQKGVTYHVMLRGYTNYSGVTLRLD